MAGKKRNPMAYMQARGRGGKGTRGRSRARVRAKFGRRKVRY